MNDKAFLWQPFKTGIFILVAEVEDYFGIAFNFLYDNDSKDLKITIQFGFYIFVIGWHFK